MACIRKRRGKWVLDYRDQQGRRHWETTDGNRKDAELLMAQRLQEIGTGEFRTSAEQETFEKLVEAYTAARVHGGAA